MQKPTFPIFHGWPRAHRLLGALILVLVFAGTPACQQNPAPTPEGQESPAQTTNAVAIPTPPSVAAPTSIATPLPVAAASSAEPIIIDVYVDFVCPWCYIGTVRFDRALKTSGLADRVIVRRHPFLLDPNVPDEGVDQAERLRAKYGREPKEMFARVEAVARESGIPLDYTKQPRAYPTVLAHALMQHVSTQGATEAQQRDIEAALFRLHFVEGGRLSDLESLVKIATTHGLAEAPARAALADPASRATVLRLAASAKGIGGVPYFKFPGGETMSGAQSEEALVAAIKRAATASASGDSYRDDTPPQ